jgi:hypothetical protein
LSKVKYFAGNAGQRRKDKASSGMPHYKTAEIYSQHNYTTGEEKKERKRKNGTRNGAKHVETMLCAA